MHITVNGDKMDCGDNCNIVELIEQMSLTNKRIAVEVNLEVIPRSQHAEFQLSENDQVEIIHAVGGG